MQNNEVWKSVIGYEGLYEASSLGRIRRIATCRGRAICRILRSKPPSRWCDYKRVQISRNDIKKTCAVHVLVAEAFHGKRPRNKFPNHKDLNKVNNSSDNLEWLTRKQNARHFQRNGAKCHIPMLGEKNGRAKLTASQVREIRAVKGVIGQRIIAALFGVSKTAIQLIHQGKHWPPDLRVREFPKLPEAA